MLSYRSRVRQVNGQPNSKYGEVTGVNGYIVKNSNPVEVRYQSDGEIDFVVDKSSGNNPSLWSRKVRWYGLPRDTDGIPAIDENDVVPVADVVRAYGTSQLKNEFERATWEAEVPTPMFGSGGKLDYSALTAESRYMGQGGAVDKFRYTAAFHNNPPKMIRVMIKVQDPNGRLQEGQWHEYVLSR